MNILNALILNQNVEEDLQQFEKIVVDERPFDHQVEFGEDSSDYGGSDEMGSVESSYTDDEAHVPKPKRKTPKFKTYRRETDLRHPDMTLGLKFSSMKECREAIREFSICTGKPLAFKVNQPHRVKVECKGVEATKCQFLLCAGFVGEKGPTIRVKQYVQEHSCGRLTSNCFDTSTWLAARFDQEIRLNPKIKIGDFITTVKNTYGIIVTKDQVYKARQKAANSIKGSIEEQYGMLRDYGEELMRVNPGTTVIIKTEVRNEEPIFLRMYVCYGALKTAFAIAELENRDSWTWFLDIFVVDMGIQNDGTNWVFISDKHKGLEAAIKDLVSSAEHRHCVKHFYNNFKGAGHAGLGLKQTMWGAAKSTTIPWFEAEMDMLFKQSKEACDWFQEPGRSPNHWSISHFTIAPKCDILLNNLYEAFNSAIIPARDQPILIMLERLRIYLMLRMAKQREKRWTQEAGPRIFDIVEKNKKDGDLCIVDISIRGHYEVTHLHGRKFYVDLERKTCSCRKWNLCGIPCYHAIASICWMQRNPLYYVHSYYKRASYDRAYAHYICPMSSQDLWPKTGQTAIRPLKIRKQAGRPKKSRIKEQGEILKGATKLPRYDVIVICRVCGGEGHNRTSCLQGLRGGRVGIGGVHGGRVGRGGRIGRGGKVGRGGAEGGRAGRGGRGTPNQQGSLVPSAASSSRVINQGGHARQASCDSSVPGRTWRL
ncbi:uncharacterized protein LOC126796756 [Argentina anserina]|uniref:uncharacterized protein LOC126796756 n=1 Tax=Argentina anserina TaxID=57926 RepID=UPI002176599C|nr:uncharacterized protein LOC126796756 [Potentilla anserina]